MWQMEKRTLTEVHKVCMIKVVLKEKNMQALLRAVLTCRVVGVGR